MSNDLEILSTPDVPDGLPPPTPPGRIPNFGHTVLFFTVAVIVLLLTSFSVFALAMSLHLLGRETPEQLLREPRLLIPTMAVGYLIAGAIVWAIFTYLWQRSFAQALHWNFAAVRRRWGRLLAGRRCFEPGGAVPVEFPSHSQDTAHRRFLSHACRCLDGRAVWNLHGSGV